jgi:hypothetical protein
MAWSSPFTAVTGNVFTASQWNQYGRDNLRVSEAAVALSAGGLICTTAANTLIQRNPDVLMIPFYDSTTTTTYVDLPLISGPAITVANGTACLISVGSLLYNDTAGLGSRITFALSGSNTLSATDDNSFYAESGTAKDTFHGTWTGVRTGMTAGSTTFTVKYRTTAGGGTSTFAHRVIAVVPF